MNRSSALLAASRVALLALLVLTLFSTPADAASPLRDARVTGALFKPTRREDGISWDARWVLAPETHIEMSDGAPRILRFAVPLPAGEVLEFAPGLVAVVENGHVTAVQLERDAIDGRTVHAVLRQPVAHGVNAQPLGAPVANGSVLQIVDADLGGGTRIEIETAGVLERRVGHVAPPGVSRAAREEARRLTGYDAGLSGAALYVRGDDVKALDGVAATIVTPRARGHRGMIAIALGFAGIVAGLLFAVRRLRHQASIEHADAVLAAEVDALNQPERPSAAPASWVTRSR